MFLFTINTIFIALSTFLITKFLKFPIVKYLDSKRKKTISRVALGVSAVILGFSIYSFVNLIKENQFHNQAKNFIQSLKDQGLAIITDEEENLDYDKKTITFYVLGNVIEDSKIKEWQEEINKKSSLKNTKLIVKQKDDSAIFEKVELLTELYNKNQSVINSREESLQEKEIAILKLEKEVTNIRAGEVPFVQICKEVNVSYSGIEKMSYALEINSDFIKYDTLRVFNVHWYDSIPKKEIDLEKVKLQKWLKARLDLDTIVLNVK